MSGNAKAEEEKFKKYIKGLFIYLKRDGCTCLRTYYFRVNITLKDANNVVLLIYDIMKFIFYL